MLVTSVLAFSAALLVAGAALAQPIEKDSPCAADAVRLCAGPSQPSYTCLTAHMSSLTPACQRRMQASRADVRDAKERLVVPPSTGTK